MTKTIMASLIIEDSKGNSQKLQMRNSKGEVCDTVALPILDYMLSSYQSLERYFEEALKNNWISSADVTVKIVSTEGKEYQLPFGKNVETIFRCSESATFKGGIHYIEKGNQPQMVSVQEFEEFFNEFLYTVLSDIGLEISKDYFKEYSEFNSIIKKYQSLSQKEDDMYAASEANALEKGFSSCRNPKTIEDYLRDYSIFREALEFIHSCQMEKNKKIEENAQSVEKEEVTKTELNEKHEASYYANKRSLCYIIGNNAAPLILMTSTPKELDDYIVSNFNNAKDVRRAYKEKIVEYIKQHKDYVLEIRNSIGNDNYNGQLAILEYTDFGTFKRLSGGQYFRIPVIYTSTFKNINKLYCNINALRRQYQDLSKEIRRTENEIRVKQAEIEYVGLQDQLAQAVTELEEKQRITNEEKQKTLHEIQTIISDMKDLEETDYKLTKDGCPTRPRMFSKHVVKEIHHVEATCVPRTYKIALDEWARAIRESDYKYDHIRFILRYLRKKGNYVIEKEENREIEVDDNVPMKNIIEMNKEYIYVPEKDNNTYDEEEAGYPHR